ncbi:MAG: hypothetical protein F6K23_38480 [Okeania sp. SIO2C9]|uniref:hypothetical protein n=1 Tax=Okeania sp. SIO2C9 TaxID=2607791 RepID=UPI0013BFB65D|nr:hypothetical protein [Okeania sp. SIO2C9]NEQ78364.1 hypothetical protein [Okeania sp. SIO2C9]
MNSPLNTLKMLTAEVLIADCYFNLVRSRTVAFMLRRLFQDLKKNCIDLTKLAFDFVESRNIMSGIS